MGPDIMMKGVVASYLASPQGMEMIHNYISSSGGQVSIREYLATPQGKQTALDILPLVLDAVDLPGDVKNLIREKLG
jgi:tripartite-type tricarboxylate transporter receptor subunit TctC